MQYIAAEKGKHVIVLERGEKIMASLTEKLTDLGLKGAGISGIGAVCKVDLAYFDVEAKKYQRKNFDQGDYELANFNGNLSLNDGKPFVHAHVVMADTQYRCLGGHLFEAEVAVTAEMIVEELGVMPVRSMNCDLGLALIREGA